MGLKGAVHRLVAVPWVYELVQLAVGARIIDRALRLAITQIVAETGAGTVADIGGGTGRARSLWPSRWTYLCIDTDPVKLQAFRSSQPSDRTLVGDAAALPLDGGTCDAALMKFVAHHLADGELRPALAEAGRVIKDSGRLIFVDAVYSRTRLVSRLLWRYDRGSRPRPLAELCAALSEEFTIEGTTEVRLLHRYVIVVGRPRR